MMSTAAETLYSLYCYTLYTVLNWLVDLAQPVQTGLLNVNEL